MAEHAQQTMYRKEAIAMFEKRQSLARHTVTTEIDVKGNIATFLVAGSNGATAVTRGLNGDIPTRPEYFNQPTVTLQEWHDVPERTRFNIYTSQGGEKYREMMQMSSSAVLNRKIDEDIHTALATGTLPAVVMTQTGAPAFLAKVLEAKTVLAENNALEEEPFCLITPAFHANLMQVPQFTSMDYINLKPFENVSKSRAFNWLGVNWIVDSALPGVGTSTADCFMFSKQAIGHACNTAGLDVAIGYDEKNDKSWARTSIFMGTAVLQNSGIQPITHDDTDVSLAA